MHSWIRRLVSHVRIHGAYFPLFVCRYAFHWFRGRSIYCFRGAHIVVAKKVKTAGTLYVGAPIRLLSYPADFTYLEVLVLLCYKKSRRQQGQRGSERAR